MKIIYTVILSAGLASCTKENIQKKQENLIIQAMVNGQWKVTSYVKGGTDVTTDFALYKFQFKTNLTVDAINSSTVEKTGTWNADADALTITSNFPNAINPLVLLNGTWQITNTTWTSVQANQTVSGEVRNLRLDKL
jgi:hypothetical protein